MSLQWTLIAGFLYVEILVVLLLLLPIISPLTWQRFFKSKFLKRLTNQATFFFLLLLGILVLFLLDAIREMRKYSTNIEHKDYHLDTEMQGNMRLFRAQRNFYICGFALFLSLVIRRLVTLISAQAILLAQNEAAMRQAQSATTTAKHLLSQKAESAQNDFNEAHNEEIAEWKNQIKELQTKNKELEDQVIKEKKDKETIKSQAESLAKEYDRLNDEHSKCLQSSGDKKSRLSMGIFVAVNVIGFPLYYQNWKEVRRNIIEAKSQELATLPILYAEKDRALLKHMKRLRDIEDDVMKDFPYWETGTLFGTPIYESLPEDTYIEPLPMELYTYTSLRDYPIHFYSHLLT